MSVGYSRRTRVRSPRERLDAHLDEGLELGLDPVLLQAGILAEVDLVFVEDLEEFDDELLALRTFGSDRVRCLRIVHGGLIQLSGL